MAKVLVSDSISEKGIQLMKDADLEVEVKTDLTPEQLIEEIPNYNALVVRSGTKVTAEVLEAAKNLKVVSRAGVGLDNVDVEAATKKGVYVFNTPCGNTIAAAEHTIALILALSRHVPQAHSSLKGGAWDRKSFTGVELHGKTLGVVGFGRIGREVAKCAAAFEMKILVSDPFASEEDVKKPGAELVEIDRLLKESDYITVHVPLNEETRNMIDEKQFSEMKQGVKVINVARGGIINEKALHKALDEGKVAGAALDVYESEPPEFRELIDLPNVVATPHLGASTEEAQEKCGLEAAEQIIAALKEGKLEGAVNFKEIKK